MRDQHPTIRQQILFAVIVSALVSVSGTLLAVGIFGHTFAAGLDMPSLFAPHLAGSGTKNASDQPVRSDELVITVVEAASPAVVSVVATRDVPVIERYYIDPFGNDPFFRDFFGNNGNPDLQIPQERQNGTQKREVSAGTGFLVSADGYIVTNKHVVADTQADYTVLMNDGKKVSAKVVARDPAQDLAVLKISGSNLPFLHLGDSSGIKIGQTAIAIGNALGEFRNTVSVGVISGLQRSVTANGGADGPESLQELVQTDAAINPGNSGGPLLNLNGEVVAINTAVASGAQNIGFAIPINKVKSDLASVRASRRIIYPYLGVHYVPVTDELVRQLKLGRDYGAYVSKNGNQPGVVPGSPAERAGLKDGDIILTLNGERVDANTSLASLIQKHQVGELVLLGIFRDHKESAMQAKLEERQ